MIALSRRPLLLQRSPPGAQAYNRHVKNHIATLDAMTVHEAMHGGFRGLGGNDRKLIISLCTRTKAQLGRTRHKRPSESRTRAPPLPAALPLAGPCASGFLGGRYLSLYDKDICEEVRSETGGRYGRMMARAMSSPADYVADMIDLACKGMGCDAMTLLPYMQARRPHEMGPCMAGATR